jgi:hypothetical protein
MKYTYKYLIQGKLDKNWFTIMSFTPSMKIEDYIKEQREMHPNWDVRVKLNPNYKN